MRKWFGKNKPGAEIESVQRNPAPSSEGVPESSGSPERLFVLQDLDTGMEFYLDMLDQFALDGRQYVAFFPMMDKRQTRSPQLVLLRLIQGNGEPGNTQYESIRNRKELQKVFDEFFLRYERSLRQV